MKTRTLKRVALILLVLLGLTGVWGGYQLIWDPTGDSLKMSTDLIQGTPFQNYLIPGIVLFTGIGLVSLLISMFVLIQHKYYPTFVMLQGVLLVVWLSSQLVFNIEFFFAQTHIPYYILGISLMLLGWKLQIRIREEET